ncbi:uncharacterized protein METZ01_LOCUS473404, partial [marine metagenome]
VITVVWEYTLVSEVEQERGRRGQRVRLPQ